MPVATILVNPGRQRVSRQVNLTSGTMPTHWPDLLSSGSCWRNYRCRLRRTPEYTDGRCRPGQACRHHGSPHRCLASDEETAGSIRPPHRGFPPASLFSHRLPNLMVVSDFGSRMGATMSAQLRLDTLIVATGRFLTSPDIGFRSPVAGRPACVVVIDVAVRTASRSAGRPRRPLSFCRGQALQFWAELRRASARR
jgi:hypothetical protein